MKSLTARLDRIEESLASKSKAEERCPVCQAELVELPREREMEQFRRLAYPEKLAVYMMALRGPWPRWCPACAAFEPCGPVGAGECS
jgi:hypothetical protein